MSRASAGREPSAGRARIPVTEATALEQGLTREEYQQITAQLGRVFGPLAEKPIGYLEKAWAEDPFSGGCPVGLMGPGTLERYGAALRAPIGRVHFAGTETATVWCGYMEGAVSSGERAAKELSRLS